MSGEHFICYDITSPRRRLRVHTLLKQYALPLQYSVFYFRGTEQQLEHCLNQLQRIIDPHTDDVRAYPLPKRGLRLHFGQLPLPQGIHMGHLPSIWQTPDEDQALTTKMPDAPDDSETATNVWCIT